MEKGLVLKDLHAGVEGKEIIKGISLSIKSGEIHALMGPNGSGKSTLAYAVMGNPKYKITKGKLVLGGKDITSLDAAKRAKQGLFLSFQNPVELPGITVSHFLRSILNTGKKKNDQVSVADFYKLVKEKLRLLQIDESFLRRYVNEGFSGGEKKKLEILQMGLLEPKIAILDETDSGTDVDALRTLAEGVNTMVKKSNTGVLLITHYTRILQYIKPKFVHVLIEGRMAKSGDYQLAHKIEAEGYAKFFD